MDDYWIALSIERVMLSLIIQWWVIFIIQYWIISFHYWMFLDITSWMKFVVIYNHPMLDVS